MKPLFQILSTGGIRAELLYLGMLCAKRGADVGVVFGHRGYMANSRNSAIQTFLESPCDVLVQCDEDVIPPLNILDIIQHRKGIVGTVALYAGESGPRPNFAPLTGSQADLMPLKEGDIPLVEVLWIGTGCYSITREAALHMIEKYGAVFAQDTKPDGTIGKGVDVFMCHRAREAGLNIFLDRKMLCGHNKDMIWAPTKDGELVILPWGSMWVNDDVPKDGDGRKSYGELLQQMGFKNDAGITRIHDA